MLWFAFSLYQKKKKKKSLLFFMKTSDLLVSLAWSRQGVAPVNGLSVGIRTRAWTRRGHPCFYLPAGSVLSSTLQL